MLTIGNISNHSEILTSLFSKFRNLIQKDPEKQKAEVLAYFGKFDTAEKQYLDLDRKDLAVDLRFRLGDWFRVLQMIKSGGGGDDVALEKACTSIGDYYFERQRWRQAVNYYQQGKALEQQVECLYHLEDFDALSKMSLLLPDAHPLLKNLAGKFVTVGMSQEAVSSYIKAGDIKSAVDTCVYLNQWNTAVELAEGYNFGEIEGLLAKYASYLLEKKKRVNAIELYRRANDCQKSAQLLVEVKKGKKFSPYLLTGERTDFPLLTIELSIYSLRLKEDESKPIL